MHGLNIPGDHPNRKRARLLSQDFFFRACLCEQGFIFHPAKLDIFRPQPDKTIPQAWIMPDRFIVRRESLRGIFLKIVVNAGRVGIGYEVIESNVHIGSSTLSTPTAISSIIFVSKKQE
jgi:hypothetical protein